jgi:hypothetical protein
MSADIDEDDFLYGEEGSQAPKQPSSNIQQTSSDQNMEQVSEGEVSDEDEDEESDSVLESKGDGLMQGH